MTETVEEYGRNGGRVIDDRVISPSRGRGELWKTGRRAFGARVPTFDSDQTEQRR
ncbi:hypothetical protein [Streptosporangium sp. LJ11]|uniref:hypothetical protein n=1 Tax=Streptosporangium sp. LJ11 TaxID=3436927 RepID=UPI003F7AE422